jgi:hypothetical protein
MEASQFLGVLILCTAIYLLAKGFRSAYIILFRCPNRGDVIRYVNYQNEGWNSFVQWGKGDQVNGPR